MSFPLYLNKITENEINYWIFRIILQPSLKTNFAAIVAIVKIF